VKKNRPQICDQVAPSVVHVAPTPFFSNRGCHIRILNEIEGLRDCGVKTILCTYGLGNNISELDIRRIIHIPGYTKTEAGFSPYKFIADILLFFVVLKTVFKERPRVIHGHLHEGGLISWLVSRILFWRKVSVVMDIQGSLSGELKAYGTFKSFPLLLNFFYFLERRISCLPDKIACSSVSSMDFIINKCGINPSRIFILEDVVPGTFFNQIDKHSARNKFNIPNSKKVVIYTGSLLSGKGVDILLDAIIKIVAERSDIIFILIGYPKEWVEHFAEEHGIKRNTILPGEVKYFELADWLATADLAVDPKLPGSGEASGKILHYMASALSVACFNSNNNKRLLGDNCFFAPDKSAEGLKQAIEMALTDESRRNMNGADSRNKAKAEFSLDATGLQLKAMYKSLSF